MTVGFGINFAKNSVFFTKNGQLIHETQTNFDSKLLIELRNLHATVKCDVHEFKVNTGSRPFQFNVLKYQQQHTSDQPLQLYSEKGKKWP